MGSVGVAAATSEHEDMTESTDTEVCSRSINTDEPHFVEWEETADGDEVVCPNCLTLAEEQAIDGDAFDAVEAAAAWHREQHPGVEQSIEHLQNESVEDYAHFIASLRDLVRSEHLDDEDRLRAVDWAIDLAIGGSVVRWSRPGSGWTRSR
jgi:hypothetical protein